MGRRTKTIDGTSPASIRGRGLRALRLERGLALHELAASAGISESYLSRIERGLVTQPHKDILIELAKALGTNPEDLFRVMLEDSSSILEPQFDRLAQLIIESTQRIEDRIVNEMARKVGPASAITTKVIAVLVVVALIVGFWIGQILP